MYAILVESDTVYCYDVIETQKGEKFYIKEDGFPFKYKKQMAFTLKLFKKKESAEVYSKNWEPPWWVKPIAFKIVEVTPKTKIIGYEINEDSYGLVKENEQ